MVCVLLMIFVILQRPPKQPQMTQIPLQGSRPNSMHEQNFPAPVNYNNVPPQITQAIENEIISTVILKVLI